MLGRQHLMLSIATVGVLVAPYLGEAGGIVLVVLIGAGIGSLIPDVDAEDAAVFHQDVKGLNRDYGKAVNSLVGPILPVFGYSTKYLIYKPAVKFFDFLVFRNYSFREKHRSFSHSILGVCTLTAVTGFLMALILTGLELFSPLYFSAFITAYLVGAFLHLLEDSATKTGIAWNSPFSSKKVKGKLSTGKDIKIPRFFLYYLGFLCLVSFFVGNTGFYSIPDLYLSGVFSFVLGFSWLFFMKFLAKARIVD